MKNINVFPRATEKSYAQSKQNTYVFDAPTSANRQEIVAAIEKQFGVKVESIKTLVQKGKAVRFSKGKRANHGTTTRKDFKKAYVTLVEGNSIRIFDEVAAEESAQKAEKKENK